MSDCCRTQVTGLVTYPAVESSLSTVQLQMLVLVKCWWKRMCRRLWVVVVLLRMFVNNCHVLFVQLFDQQRFVHCFFE